MQKPHILYIEDDLRLARILIDRIEVLLRCHPILHLPSADTLSDVMRENSIDLVLLDLALDAREQQLGGQEQIPVILRVAPEIPIVVLSGHEYQEAIRDSLRAGVVSFISKPASLDEVVAVIRDRLRATEGLRRGAFTRGLSPLHRQSNGIEVFGDIVGRSQLARQLIQDARFAAANTIPVMIIGETGTGKSALAHAIHENMARLRPGQFVRFAPSFGSHDLMMSELFGHARGAFTGATDERRGLIEEADRGTLLIDEVGELPTTVQILLLEVLQKREFRKLGTTRVVTSDFRLLSATNLPRNLLEQRLRADFLHRAGHIILEIPPLRHRPEDIEPIALHLFARAIERNRTCVQTLTQAAIRALELHDWSGNVRELQAVIETAVARADFQGVRSVTPSFLNLGRGRREPSLPQRQTTQRSLPLLNSETVGDSGDRMLRRNLRQYERHAIAEAMRHTGGNQRDAAALLGIDRGTLRRALRRQ